MSEEPSPKELTPDQIERIREALGERDGFAKALNLHRAMTGASLKETSDFIHSLQPPSVQNSRKLSEAAYAIAQEHREGRLNKAQTLGRLAREFPEQTPEACASALFGALAAWEWESPDGRRLTLECQGELRFGPRYYTLSFDGRPLRDRIFDEQILWRYLVFEELPLQDERAPDRTRLLALDTASMRQGVVDDGGRFSAFELKGSVLSYVKDSGERTRLERDLSSITDWTPVRGR